MTSTIDMSELLRVLDEQCADYRAMYDESLAQRDCLRGEDMTGLNEATGRMRALMDRVRQRHAGLPSDLPRLERESPQVAQRTDSLRQTIRSVLELRAESERATRQLLGDTRRQLQQVKTGERASRGYRRRVLPQDSRFVDNVR